MGGLVGKIARAYRNDGLGGVIVRILTRLGMHESEILKSRRKTNLYIRDLYDSKVAYGPFKGMQMARDTWWGQLNFAAKILGTYEAQVIERIGALAKPQGLFVDIGSADGFFAAGVLRAGWFDRALCFEISEAGRKFTTENATRNGVGDKVDVRGQADAQELIEATRDQADALILCDIEGAEFDLFDDRLLAALKGKTLVIELHPHLVADGAARCAQLIERAGAHFNTEVMRQSPLPVADFPELHGFDDSERLLAFSEGRGGIGGWLILT
jgi:predicted O-methyltransferase YrrM